MNLKSFTRINLGSETIILLNNVVSILDLSMEYKFLFLYFHAYPQYLKCSTKMNVLEGSVGISNCNKI